MNPTIFELHIGEQQLFEAVICSLLVYGKGVVLSMKNYGKMQYKNIAFLILAAGILVGTLLGLRNEQQGMADRKAVFVMDVYEETEVAEYGEDREQDSAEEPSVEKEEGIKENMFSITKEEFSGNILGYTLHRYNSDLWYEKDMDYLLDESVVGNGVYVSEHVCETEFFIGSLLKEMIDERGQVKDNKKAFFTEYAMNQLHGGNWNLLSENWKPDPYAYDRYYELDYALGHIGYEFQYIFYPKTEIVTSDETQIVFIWVVVNGDGIIYNANVWIESISSEKASIIDSVSDIGLYIGRYREAVIERGMANEGKILLNYARYEKSGNPSVEYEQKDVGLLASGDASISAQLLGDILIQTIRSRGKEDFEYAEMLKDINWDVLDLDWVPDKEYECYYEDIIDKGYVNFLYYFYPDYQEMRVKEANVVVISCMVSVSQGEVWGYDFKTFPMKQNEYMNMPESDTKTFLIEKGKISETNIQVEIPVPEHPVIYVPLQEYQKSRTNTEHYIRERKNEIWGFSNAAEMANYLGHLFFIDFETGNMGDIIHGKTRELYVGYKWQEWNVAKDFLMNVGWQTDERYDCYYIKENECANCIHLQYIFYGRNQNDNLPVRGQNAVIDVYVSESGIEDIRINII